MNKKHIGNHLYKKIEDWISSIEDDEIKEIVRQNAIITGGSIVSLLNGVPPKDYDVYFKTKDSLKKVASYYIAKFNETHKAQYEISVFESEDGRIKCRVKSAGVAVETQDVSKQKTKYRPRHISANAISLSDKIQIVVRFYGSVGEIHENYDFIHCTCSYDHAQRRVELPSAALEAIINKELFYVGSKYPLCSIIRTRKFLNRGWHINAGQYLKMAFQLNELDLHDLNVLEDQLTGVDSVYFLNVIQDIHRIKERDPDADIDNFVLFEVINRVF